MWLHLGAALCYPHSRPLLNTQSMKGWMSLLQLFEKFWHHQAAGPCLGACPSPNTLWLWLWASALVQVFPAVPSELRVPPSVSRKDLTSLVGDQMTQTQGALLQPLFINRYITGFMVHSLMRSNSCCGWNKIWGISYLKETRRPPHKEYFQIPLHRKRDIEK